MEVKVYFRRKSSQRSFFRLLRELVWASKKNSKRGLRMSVFQLVAGSFRLTVTADFIYGRPLAWCLFNDEKQWTTPS